MISFPCHRVVGLLCLLTASLAGLSGAADVPLGQAADQPGLTWTTSAEHPFRGLADSGAKNGSSAKGVLSAGEQSWLEVELPGPGVLDFWLRLPAAFHNLPAYELWEMWKVEVDGVPAAISGMTWPALYLTTPGPHRVRWICTAPEAFPDPDVITMAVGGIDDVSWAPFSDALLAESTGAPQLTWTTGGDRPWSGADGLGPVNVQMAAATSMGYEKGNSWLETTVTGPGMLTWQGKALGNLISTEPNLTIDGGKPIELHTAISDSSVDGWQDYRLSLPAGTHTIRWNAESSGYDAPWDSTQPYDFSAGMAICRVNFTTEASYLATAVQAPGYIFLETSFSGYSLHEGGWQTRPGESLYIQAAQTGWTKVEWKLPLDESTSTRSQFMFLPGPWVYLNPQPEDDAWQASRIFLEKGEWLEFQADGQFWDATDMSAVIRKVNLEAVPGVSLTVATEQPWVTADSGWHGIASAAEAHDGVDVALSVPYDRYTPNRMEKVITGSATVRFWWRAEGAATLSLCLEGQPLAVKAAGETWQQVELQLGAGVHRLSWEHLRTGPFDDLAVMNTPARAWVDEIHVLLTTPTMTFADAVSASGRSFAMSETGAEWRTAVLTGEAGVVEPAAYSTALSEDGAPKVVSTFVTGPGVLSFQGQLKWGTGNDVPAVSAQREMSSSSVIITLPGSGNPSQGYLVCYVDGVYRASIAEGGEPGWKSVDLAISAGEHLVEWKVERSSGSSSVPAGTQAWLRKFSMQSPAAHYWQWAGAAGIPTDLRDPNADADGDGVTNAMEYALGLNPLDGGDSAGSRIGLLRGTGFTGSPVVWFSAPPVQAYAQATLQVSTDLVHWEKEPNLFLPTLSTGYSRATFPRFDLITQAVTAVEPGRYYRIKVDLEE